MRTSAILGLLAAGLALPLGGEPARAQGQPPPSAAPAQPPPGPSPVGPPPEGSPPPAALESAPWAPPPPPPPAPTGQATGGPCGRDVDCAAGLVCDAGRCAAMAFTPADPRPRCGKDADCPGQLVCEASRCVFRQPKPPSQGVPDGPCLGNAQCSGGQICVAYRCADRPPSSRSVGAFMEVTTPIRGDLSSQVLGVGAELAVGYSVRYHLLASYLYGDPAEHAGFRLEPLGVGVRVPVVDERGHVRVELEPTIHFLSMQMLLSSKVDSAFSLGLSYGGALGINLSAGRFFFSLVPLHVEHRYVTIQDVGADGGFGLDYRARFGIGFEG